MLVSLPNAVIFLLKKCHTQCKALEIGVLKFKDPLEDQYPYAEPSDKEF